MRRTTRILRRSKDGGMPFVAIGVVLLILGSAYGVVISQAKDVEEAADSIITELGTLDSAITGTKTSVERGLGELIWQISTDPEGGSLEKRTESFKERSDAWIKANFPSADRGVSVSIRDFDFALAAESLKMTSSDDFTDGFMPSYLKATGHYTAEFISGSGTSVRTTEISTDGTCALPLVAEQGSLFEIMVSGEGSALSQMMTHQLTALAQYRVLNGYGALGEYGDMGTMSIITAEDVKASYDSSMRVLELLVFRYPSEGLGADVEKIDIADIFVTDDGCVEIDLSAVYSQALISVMDDIVLQWIDYLNGNIYIDLADFLLDHLSNAWDSLVGFFSGKNELSAAPYIERMLADNGLDAGHYKHLFSGKKASISVPSTDVAVGGRTVRISSLALSPDYPSVDLMEWSGISKFKSNYREETNEIREWIRSIINTAAVSIGTSKALGTIRIPLDPKDDETFMETVKKAVDRSLKEGSSELDRIMTSAIKDQRISDPFCSAIFDVISKDKESIYRTGDFKENIRSSVSSSLASYFEKEGIRYTAGDLDNAVGTIMGTDSVKRAVSNYEEAVEGCMDGLRKLSEIPAGKSGTFKNMCTAIFTGGIALMDVAVNIPDRISTLCSEMIENTGINAYSGAVGLPGTDRFVLTGSDGKTSVEKLTVTSSSSPRIKVGGPNDNLKDCIHYVGFNQNTGASYSTTFSVTLKDDLDCTIKSSGTLESAMGVSDSVYKSKMNVDLDLKITVASGWELAGVKGYVPSNYLLIDAWNALIELLAPILEPLRKVMSMIMDALSILGSALLELTKYVAKVVETLYNILLAPLEMLAEFIEEMLGKIFNFVLEQAVDKIQWIVGIDLSKQTVGFSFMGFTLTFTTKLATLVNNTKTLLTVTLSGTIFGLAMSVWITIKQKGSGSGKEMLLTGGANISGNTWSVNADIDPLMKSSGHMIVMDGHVRGVKFDILLPDLVQYKYAEFSLSDIPGVGTMLDNIPLPIPGLKASIDAGISLKYNIPFETGILINEFELNPPGDDKDNEWVE
ncbi:MAG: hypothetical protein LBH88_02350, partial [Candidatus Methanoplasma sp.]|nr:hypothetical protein [Candidatus Methanoplasma sp.]